MDKLNVLSKTSKISRNIFVIFLVVFAISLLPVTYTAGYSSGLAGAAGTSNPDPIEVSDNIAINYYIAMIAGVISSVSLAISAIANLRVETLKLKTERMRQELQLREVEKYRLEEKAEERKKKKKI